MSIDRTADLRHDEPVLLQHHLFLFSDQPFSQGLYPASQSYGSWKVVDLQHFYLCAQHHSINQSDHATSQMAYRMLQ